MESKAGYFFVAQISGPRILGSMAFNFSMGVTEGPEVASVMTTGGSRGGVRKGGVKVGVGVS